MSNYEAVKPLTKTEDLVNCQSKRHLRVIKHCVTLRSPNINTRKMLAPRAVQGSSVKGHFSKWQPHTEEAIWLSVRVWDEAIKGSLWCGGMESMAHLASEAGFRWVAFASSRLLWTALQIWARLPVGKCLFYFHSAWVLGTLAWEGFKNILHEGE